MSLPVFDLTLPTLAENLALDEALLLEAESGAAGEVLRFWEWPVPAVVLGAGGELAKEVDEEACRSDEVSIQRRASGGGTVLLGSGCLVYSLVLSFNRDPAFRDVNASYRHILGRMVRALTPFAELGAAGTSDLAVAGRKVSGNSQQRKRDHLLHHGTILYAFHPFRIGRYLRSPAKEPAYRGGRSHEAFVTNLRSDAEALKRSIADEWGAVAQDVSIPFLRIAELVAQKYGRADWPRRR